MPGDLNAARLDELEGMSKMASRFYFDGVRTVCPCPNCQWSAAIYQAAPALIAAARRAERYGAALNRMLSPETDWPNGATGVGYTFRSIARAALKEPADA